MGMIPPPGCAYYASVKNRLDGKLATIRRPASWRCAATTRFGPSTPTRSTPSPERVPPSTWPARTAQNTH